MSWLSWAAESNREVEAAELRRYVRNFDARGPVGILDDGREVTSFASNDYLGLAHHPEVIAAAQNALRRWGTGSGAARLIVGSRPVHSELEGELADWKGAERALIFSTGYMTNLGVLDALGTPGALICSDELNHASIIDGCRLARADVAVYPHKNLPALDELLRKADRAVVVSDAVFSMDGDVAPVDELADLCGRRGALLLLDEAHAVLGPGVSSRGHVLRMGTLSKTLGALGGFVAGPAEIIDYLTSAARSFIFTTALSPADTAAALAALRLLTSTEGATLTTRLRALVDRLAPEHPSPIVPVVLGHERTALDAAGALLDRGFLVPAIRPPSVPAGSARLRVTLSAAHTFAQVDALQDALRETVGA